MPIACTLRKPFLLLTTALTTTAIGGGLFVPSALAAETAPVGVEQVAQATGAQSFAIPAQPLAAALDAFVAQTGWQLGYASDLVAGKTSPGVQGTFSPTQALDRLLAGSGLAFRPTGAGVATLERAPAAGGAVTLDPVTVEALRGITSYQPTVGYVSYYSVAATKTDTPIIEAPQSITTIGRKEMDDRDVKTIAEAVRYSPGVMVDAYGVDPRGYDSIQIRGFSAATTGSFRDGLRMDGNVFAVYTTEPYGVERVDIMRGASGALYGQAEAGGVIDRTTKRPDADMKQEVFTEYGSWNTVTGGFDIGGKVMESDKVLVRLTGLASQGNTEYDYNDGTDQHVDRVFIAPALTVKPTEDTTVTILTDYMKDHRSPQFNTLATETTGRSNVVPGEPGFDRFNQEQYSLGYTLAHAFTDALTFRQTARHTNVEVDYQAVVADSLAADNRTINRYVWASPDELNQQAIDNQLEAKFNLGPTKHVTLMGIDYSHSDDEYQYYYGTARSLDLRNVVYTGARLPAPYQDTKQTLEQVGIYLQDQIKFDDHWVVTLGGRQSWVDMTTKQNLAGTTEKQSDSAFTGRAGLTYLFDNGLAPYVSYTEGFVPTQGTDLSGKSFEPEESTQYEAGLKYQMPETNALITASVYNLTKTNVLTRDPANINASVQAGEVRTRGAEVEAKVGLFEGLDLIASYSIIDAKVTKSNDIDKDKVPVLVPEHTASAWLQYRFGFGPLRGLELGGGVRYIGSTYTDRANTSTTADYALVDATIAYPITENVNIKLNANNLFDKEYITTCAFNSCYYGTGQRLDARLTYTW